MRSPNDTKQQKYNAEKNEEIFCLVRYVCMQRNEVLLEKLVGIPSLTFHSVMCSLTRFSSCYFLCNKTKKNNKK